MSTIRVIPPITSTGKSRRKNPAKLEGLAHMSLGRYMAKRGGGSFHMGNAQIHSDYSWDISRHLHRKPKRKTAGFICPEPQIHCKMDVIKDISGEGDLKVTLHFKGIDLKSLTFTKSKRDYGNNSSVYYAPLKHKGKDAYLFLSTIGDIVESEIVHQRKGVNRLFDNEVYIPELAEIYDPFSMKVMLTDNFITLRYKRNKLN